MSPAVTYNIHALAELMMEALNLKGNQTTEAERELALGLSKYHRSLQMEAERITEQGIYETRPERP